MDDERGWQERRRLAVEAHGAALARARAAEEERAAALIAGFVARARDRGLATAALTARSYGGRGRYRTGLRGWYLRADLAVGEDGNLYLLTVPASLRARLVGTALPPYPPRLVIGEGGRDGESIPLEVLLHRRLDADG
ncbi:hypothetical protein AB0M79_17195 [Polymorphospora sp. NPDC051019]|uniref:hypothetical protein n=1 Tax=Polymorphospora sp. NPDC051019 TaxID=3155725 RepID=UPI00342CCF14